MMAAEVGMFSSVILGLVTLASSFGVVWSRNVFHAAFWLFAAMVGVAGMFALLSATYLALIQIMVYAGAVSVLIVFTIMLTLRSREDSSRSRDISLPAVLVSIIMFIMLVVIVLDPGSPIMTGVMPDAAPEFVEFSKQLFTTWLLPFELVSLILTSALVGAIYWANSEPERGDAS